MSAWVPFASSFRRGSAPLLVCGALLCAALFMAGQHLLATLALLVLVAAAGALRRAAESGNQAHPGSARERQQPAGGLADRQALAARLDQEWRRDRRPDEPTALLLIAIDAPQLLRSQESPLALEVAMLTVSATLARMLPRDRDLLARYDETTFAAVLQGTDLPGSLRVAARFRWAIVRLGIAHPGSASGFLTACIGIAVQHGAGTGDPNALLLSTEASLHRAQQVGHDRLEYAELCCDGSAGSAAANPPPGQAPPLSAGRPTIRAWTPERVSALQLPQS